MTAYGTSVGYLPLRKWIADKHGVSPDQVIVTTGATDSSPTTRYAHNALGQRVFKTEPLYPPAQGDEGDAGFMQSLIAFFTRLWAPGASDAERLGTAFVYDEQGSLIAEMGMGGAHSTAANSTAAAHRRRAR